MQNERGMKLLRKDRMPERALLLQVGQMNGFFLSLSLIVLGFFGTNLQMEVNIYDASYSWHKRKPTNGSTLPVRGTRREYE